MRIILLGSFILLTVGGVQGLSAEECATLIGAAIQHVNVLEENLATGDALIHGPLNDWKCNAIKEYLRNNGGNECKDPCASLCTTQAPKNGELESVCFEDAVTCDVNAEYRSFDGSCNNLANPTWGQAGTPQRRVVPNAYDDGLGKPRSKSCMLTSLPSARNVSNVVHRAVGTTNLEPHLSYMMMQWGQLLAHDFTLVKVFTGSNCEALQCCGNDKNNDQCFPIQIPTNDLHFEQNGCMPFSRSGAVKDCDGVRQQVNAHSSYLDMSMIYGMTEAQSKQQRTFVGGRFKMNDQRLPPDFASGCRLDMPFDENNYYCTKSGDPRVNVQPGLSSIHTIFHIYHNVLAEGLALQNPNWNDEKLFQEARKISIGVWQNIIYEEYLPLVIGPDARRKYNLNLKNAGHDDTYDETIDATLMNVFGIAYRFGHSMVHNIISMLDDQQQPVLDDEQLVDHWLRPNFYHQFNGEGFKNILRWTSGTGCPFTDRILERSVTDLLFLDNNGVSFDLATLNIQRTRDHGLPGYNAYREFCGLSTAQDFTTGAGGLVDHDQEVADLLKLVYDCPGDINVFTGILTEKRTDSIIGPLGQCLIGLQFQQLKDGDRFFFMRQENGFTSSQLREIRKITLASLMCDAGIATETQRNVFLKPDQNDYVSCDQIPSVDLRKWKE